MGFMVRYFTILRVMGDYLEKCGRSDSTSSSGLINETPVFEYTGEKLTTEELRNIANVEAERWGLEVSVNEKGNLKVNQNKFCFWDAEHETEIVFNSYYIKNQNRVDFTNNGKGAYDLDEILSYYNDMPSLMKDATGGIVFKGTQGSALSKIYDPQSKIKNPIIITQSFFGLTKEKAREHPDSFRNLRATDKNIQVVMYHEGGHSLDNSEMMKDTKYVELLAKGFDKHNSWRPNQLLTEEEREYVRRRHGYEVHNRNTFSDTVEYDYFMKQNIETFASPYGKKSFTPSRKRYKRSEDFAETMAMASFRNLKDKSNARMEAMDSTLLEPKYLSYDEFERTHKATFDFCCDVLDGKFTNKNVMML